jgi:formamidopyrimidine-DNA glycosylase
MIELPEAMTIARQIEERWLGVSIQSVRLAEKRPRFFFLNDDPSEYDQRVPGCSIRRVVTRGKWIFLTLDSGNILLLGEMFGRIGYLSVDDPLPKKVHGTVTFSTGERLTITIQAWGGFQILTPEELAVHPYAGSQGISPFADAFTPERFDRLLDTSDEWSRKPIKAFLVHEGNVAGIGNGYLQDILFRAELSPKRKVPDIRPNERERLHGAIVDTLQTAVDRSGRDTEKDLYGQPGEYVPLLDRRTAGAPCPRCGAIIEKISYLGGSCYLCPTCQT